MSERWLRCIVAPGMFSDERAVTYRRQNNGTSEYSLFVPANKARVASEDRGAVRVRVFQKQAATWAVFPDDTQTIVPIDEADLESA